MLLNFSILDEKSRSVTAGEVSKKSIEDPLSIQKSADRQNELCEKGHPNKQKEKEDYSIPKDIQGIIPKTRDLGSDIQIADDQDDHPAYNVKPLFPKGIPLFHVSEF